MNVNEDINSNFNQFNLQLFKPDSKKTGRLSGCNTTTGLQAVLLDQNISLQQTAESY